MVIFNFFLDFPHPHQHTNIIKFMEDNKLVQGQWYWITYPYIRHYFEPAAQLNRTSTELKKCLATKDDGNNGLFDTDLLDAKWIGFSKCQKYVGKMKSKGFCFAHKP